METAVGAAVLATGFGMIVSTIVLRYQNDTTGAIGSLFLSGLFLMGVGALILLKMAFDSKHRILKLEYPDPSKSSKSNIVQERKTWLCRRYNGVDI
ncbi:MAG: hypothetical protein WAN47_10010 [Nitrosotalea sp.]